MRQVFADTCYWIALANPRDQLHERARAASGNLQGAILVTTDEVLSEFLNFFSRHGQVLRGVAAQLTRGVLADANIRVLPQSRQTFMNGMELFGNRLDKQYSLTDCISMTAMRNEALTEVLTNDHHFEQEGFTILLK